MLWFTNKAVKKAATTVYKKIDWHLSRVIQNENTFDLFLPHAQYKNNYEDWMGSALLCHYEKFMLLQRGTLFKDVVAYLSKHMSPRINTLIKECMDFVSPRASDLHNKLVALNCYDGWQDDCLRESQMNCVDWFMSKFTIIAGNNPMIMGLIPPFLESEMDEMEKDGMESVEIIRREA